MHSRQSILYHRQKLWDLWVWLQNESVEAWMLESASEIKTCCFFSGILQAGYTQNEAFSVGWWLDCVDSTLHWRLKSTKGRRGDESLRTNISVCWKIDWESRRCWFNVYESHCVLKSNSQNIYKGKSSWRSGSDVKSSLVLVGYLDCPHPPFNQISLLIPVSASHSDLLSPPAVHAPTLLFSWAYYSSP